LVLLLQQNQHYRMLPVLSEQELVPVQEQVLPPEQVLPVLLRRLPSLLL
jgi:hypothetical protein